jgi:hypothetical protein
MDKLWTMSYGGLSLSLNGYSLTSHPGNLEIFISTGSQLALIRLVVTLALFLYAFVPRFRTSTTKNAMLAMSGLMLTFGLITLLSPDLFNRRETFLPLGDTLIFFESGILTLFLGLTMPLGKVSVSASQRIFIKSLLVSQPNRLLSKQS